jgi:RNA polymerase sigma-70 factor (ECF subfamily)
VSLQRGFVFFSARPLSATHPGVPAPRSGPENHSGGLFPATRWTLVARARQSGPDARGAIEELCRGYWFPLYAFLRRRGYSQHDAEDLTQGYFQKLLDDGLFQAADADRGRLRTLLLAGLERFMADRLRHDHAQKRGGGAALVSIEWARAEERYFAEPVDERDPETIYLAAWARSLVERARARLRESYGAKAAIYTALEPFLNGEDNRARYRTAAEQHGISEATARVHVFRLRQRFGEVLEAEVAQTVETPQEAAEEMAWLRGMLAE